MSIIGCAPTSLPLRTLACPRRVRPCVRASREHGVVWCILWRGAFVCVLCCVLFRFCALTLSVFDCPLRTPHTHVTYRISIRFASHLVFAFDLISICSQRFTFFFVHSTQNAHCVPCHVRSMADSPVRLHCHYVSAMGVRCHRQTHLLALMRKNAFFYVYFFSFMQL